MLYNLQKRFDKIVLQNDLLEDLSVGYGSELKENVCDER